MSLRTKIFFLRRALGIAKILDGVATFFTPFNTPLTLIVAKKMARARGYELMRRNPS